MTVRTASRPFGLVSAVDRAVCPFADDVAPGDRIATIDGRAVECLDDMKRGSDGERIVGIVRRRGGGAGGGGGDGEGRPGKRPRPDPAAAASDIAASDGGGRSGPSVRVSYPIPARGRPGSTPPEDPPAPPSVPPGERPAATMAASAPLSERLAAGTPVGTASSTGSGGTPHGPADLPAGFARPPGKAPLLASMGALGTDGEGESIRAKLLEGEFRFEFGVDWIGLGERERERELEKKNAVACLISARPSAIYQLLC